MKNYAVKINTFTSSKTTTTKKKSQQRIVYDMETEMK